MAYYMFINDKLCIIPRLNLVSNQGVDQHATHTIKHLKTLNTKLERLDEIILHPKVVIRSIRINEIIEKNVFGGGSKAYLSFIIQKMLIKIKSLV